MNRQLQRTEQSRNSLIQAACEALVAGQGNFELQDVARRAGVSVGLPYHRFGSKAGLIAAVVEQFYDEIEQVITLSDVREQDWAKREQVRLSRLVAFLYRTPLAAVIISTLAREPEVAVVEARRWSRLITITASNIHKGQKRGQLPTDFEPEILAALICGGARHAAGLALQRQPRPDEAALVRQMWSFISTGLRLNGG
ncbi:MAG TPA: TetR/AcrR family transcriptional regulator [Xanthomonadales bacterium]|nr:TetR/AcrR family transcriptional regulator [Xanthomonadales bacterium]